MPRLTNITHHLQAARSDRSIKAWKWCMSMAEQCATMRHLKPIHALFITHGIHRNTFAASKLLTFSALSPAGDLRYAALLFSQLPNPNSYIYNTLIRAHSTKQPHLAIRYFNLMYKRIDGISGVCPDNITFPFVLIACGNAGLVLDGRKIHCWVLKNGLGFGDGHVQTALTRFYVECGFLVDARKVFDEITEWDVVQCNVIINGYVKCGLGLEGLSVFRLMLGAGIEPDEFCLTTGLAACAQQGALEQGKWIHEYVKRRGLFCSDEFVGTALVDMYAKCGCIDRAADVFESMPRRNMFSWAAMIGGFATHGYVKEAIRCLERVQVEDKLKPDGTVILGVLAACKHAGFFEKGKVLLDNMEARYGVSPEHEHYSCVVDLICKAGQLDEALGLIRSMPMKPLASVWGALLSGCRIRGNVPLAELAVEELLKVAGGNKAEEDVAYVQLANIYLAAKRCDDARRIRRMIGDRGLKKTPGCSAIEIDGEINEFVAGESSHSRISEIHAVLDLLSSNFLVDKPPSEIPLVNLHMELVKNPIFELFV